MSQFTKVQSNTSNHTNTNEHIFLGRHTSLGIKLIQLAIKTDLVIASLYRTLEDRGLDMLLLVIPLAALMLIL